MVEATFLYFHSDRYDLRAWVVMPNHVHVLFKTGEVPMRRVVESWKKRSGRLANVSLERKGPFWAADYWDTYMRNSDQEKRAIRYIENNPVKAGLVSCPKAWHSSSARFRDPNGLLVLPS